jgi:hypothetical protein
MKKKYFAWAIVNFKRRCVGFGRTRDQAWIDVPSRITHFPFTDEKPKGYKAVKFSFYI